MRLRAALRRSDALAGLVKDLRKLRRVRVRASSRRVIAAYLATHTLRKLQLGAGLNPLPGWLCTDLAPSGPGIVYLDATRPFPVPDNAFDLVSSEHMIEHISYPAGLFMLRECHRILKPGGRIRIATPDLQVLLALHTTQPAPLQQRYLRWITDRSLPDRACHPAFVINNAFRNWGHQFLYDGEILQSALQQAGFSSVTRQAPDHSEDSRLRGLEVHGEYIGDREMNNFETMCFEGVCTKQAAT
jgi:predicted SAM-dependent methyltransferase